MVRFPRDAPKRRVIRTLELLEFEVVREGNHVAMQRSNEDGSVTPLTIAYAVRAFLDPHRIVLPDGRIDLARVDATTEAEISAQEREDEGASARKAPETAFRVLT